MVRVPRSRRISRKSDEWLSARGRAVPFVAAHGEAGLRSSDGMRAGAMPRGLCQARTVPEQQWVAAHGYRWHRRIGGRPCADVPSVSVVRRLGGRAGRAQARQAAGRAVQVRRGLVVPGYGWRRHPAVRMWAGYEEALVRYGLQICGAWTAGGAPIPAPPRWSETSGRGSRGVPRERRSGWPPTGTCHRGWAHRTSIEATSPPWCARTGTSTGSASRGYRTTCRTYGPGPTGRRTGPRERRSPWASSGSAQGAADGPHIVRSPVALPTQSARPERACRFAATGEDRSRDQACR